MRTPLTEAAPMNTAHVRGRKKTPQETRKEEEEKGQRKTPEKPMWKRNTK